MIKVLIAEDSVSTGELLRMILSSDKDINVVGIAKNGRECLKMACSLRPDVITMDIRMPVLDGLEATKAIMAECPTSILVVSSTVVGDLNVTFNVLEAGALDVFEKPRSREGATLNAVGADLIAKIKKVARFSARRKELSSISTKDTLGVAVPLNNAKIEYPSSYTDKIIVLGASTGGPAVLKYILSNIPQDFPFPILVVLHISKGFVNGLVDWLRVGTKLRIKIASDQESIRKGVVYFSPDDFHMGVTTDLKIFLSKDPPIASHRPSVDFLMESVAKSMQHNCFGAILTGMGRDGANGMEALWSRGGFTVAQNEESCTIFGMPKAAIEKGVIRKVCSVDEIPQEILNWSLGIK